MDVQFNIENFADVYPEAEELLQLHWEEVGVNKDHFKLAPMPEAYQAMSEAGILVVFTARNAMSRLVGYSVFIVTPSPHYRNNIFADNDIYFIHKDYRKGFVASNFFRFMEEQLQERGVDLMVVRTKINRRMDVFFRRLNFKLTEEVFTKVLR